MLDAESDERMRLEKELKDIQVSLSGHYSSGEGAYRSQSLPMVLKNYRKLGIVMASH